MVRVAPLGEVLLLLLLVVVGGAVVLGRLGRFSKVPLQDLMDEDEKVKQR